jgi:lysophospholipase L1-like esterase
MRGFAYFTGKARLVILLFLIHPFLAGCAPATPQKSPPTPTLITPSPTAIPSLPTPTWTQSPPSTPTIESQTLVFYGDSVLKVGDVTKPAEVGFSIVDPLRNWLPSWDHIIVSHHGGLTAKWGYENLQENVIDLRPDVVTLWWGLNDLGGCPGFFDRASNALLQNQLVTKKMEHIQYLKAQVLALLNRNISVLVMTPIPVLGDLPWTHFDANNQLVWEEDHRCNFNLGLDQLAQAQRILVSELSADGSPVFLVDAWKVYQDNPNADKMYMDIVHPASHGVELIAAEWLRVFQSIDLKR